MAIIYDIDTVAQMLKEHGEVAKQEERTKWLPLWEALIKIEQFEDFTASDDLFEYSPEYNAARRNLHRAIQNLKSQGEK
jgi:hypothetical protein